MIRTLVERLSRNRSFKRRLPPPYSRTAIYVSPDAELKVLRPGAAAFSPYLLRVAAEEAAPGKVVWDVGANIGVFSFACADRGAQVVAFEADGWLVGLLERSAALPRNQRLDVTIIAGAVSDRIGTAHLQIATRGRASNSLASFQGRSQQGGVRTRIEVPTTTLDASLETHPAPDVLKIDVEGAEAAVLEGGQRLLARVRPRIYIEVGGPQNDRVTDLLRTNRYRLYDASRPISDDSAIDRCAFDTVAIPEDPQ